MAGYIGSKTSVTIVDGYNKTTADSTFVDATGDTMTGNLSFGDNNKAIFGAELEIYSDATHARIREYGGGQLKIQGDNLQLLTTNGASTYLEGVASTGAVTLYHAANAPRISTTATGIDVTGTVVADGLTVDGNILLETSGNPTITNKTTGAGNNPSYRLQADTNYWDMLGVFSDADDTLRFRYNNTDALEIANNGDISFYEDTGTTAKFFWDASAESLGIGTSSPTNGKLEVTHSSSTVPAGFFRNTSGSGNSPALTVQGGANNAAPNFSVLDYNGNTDFVVQGSGNVGIGTSSPSGELDVTASKASAVTNLYVRNPDNTGGAAIRVQSQTDAHQVTLGITDAGSGGRVGTLTNDYFYFVTNNTERLRIDTSGNVGIGTTSPVYKIDGGFANQTWGWYLNTSYNSGFTYNTTERSLLIHTKSSENIDHIKFATGGAATERMRIDSSGNVGIGTSSPPQKLSVVGASSSNANPGILAIGTDTTMGSGTNMLTMGVVNDSYVFIQGIKPGHAPRSLVLQKDGGNVGIGTSSPAYRFDVSGSGGDIANFSGNATNSMRIYLGSGYQIFQCYNGTHTNQFGYGAQGQFYVDTAGATRMTINSTGNVLVGATSFSGGVGCLQVESNGTLDIGTNTTAGSYRIQFFNPNGFVGSIATNGSSVQFNTSSDYRLKTDAQPMVGASDRVLALKPVNFEWISDGSRVDGFLAHEAQEIVPEAVTGTKDAMRDEEYEVTAAIAATYDEDGNELTAAVEAVMGTRSVPDYQGIDQSKLVPLLTAALQEALTKIASMETRLAALEAL